MKKNHLDLIIAVAVAGIVSFDQKSAFGSPTSWADAQIQITLPNFLVGQLSLKSTATAQVGSSINSQALSGPPTPLNTQAELQGLQADSYISVSSLRLTDNQNGTSTLILGTYSWQYQNLTTTLMTWDEASSTAINESWSVNAETVLPYSVHYIMATQLLNGLPSGSQSLANVGFSVLDVTANNDLLYLRYIQNILNSGSLPVAQGDVSGSVLLEPGHTYIPFIWAEASVREPSQQPVPDSGSLVCYIGFLWLGLISSANQGRRRSS